MFNRKFVDMADDILNMGILLVSIFPTQVINPSEVIKCHIDNSDEDRNADRVSPDDHNSHDIGPAVARVVELVGGLRLHNTPATAREPVEQGEKSCEDIYTEDGYDKLP